MNNALKVQVLHRLTNLVEEGKRFLLGQSLLLSEQLVQVALRTVLQNHKDISLVLKMFMQLEHILVI